MAASEKLAELRCRLAARFPTTPRISGRVLPTGLHSLDDAAGGLPLGALTEIVCAAPSCGSCLLLASLLHCTRTARVRLALVDSADSFDPASFPPDLLAHLLWVRGKSATPSSTDDALASADLLARDANLGVVVLDLRCEPAASLRRTPSTTWYRLQRAIEPTDLALVVLSPSATVPCAQLRFVLNTSHTSDALELERPSLTNALTPTLQRRRHSYALAG